MHTPLKHFTEEIRDEYNIIDITDNCYVYIEIRKGMYVLKEAGILAFTFIAKILASFGYTPVKYTPGLWKHKSRPTTFTLYVDDFGVKYHNQGDLEHLLSELRSNYKISTDFTGRNYIRLTIDWHYEDLYVGISMHRYVTKALEDFFTPHPPTPNMHCIHG